MNDPWVHQLSDYIDGEMPPGDRREFEAHLEVCESCRTTLRDLERIVAGAGRLEDQVPSRDLWGAIAAHMVDGADAPTERIVSIEAHEPVRRRISFSWPQLLAACLALVIASGAMGWLAHAWRPDAGPSSTPSVVADRATQEPGSAPDGPPPKSAPVVAVSTQPAKTPQTLAEAMVGLDKRITELQRAFVQFGRSLDPETLAVLQDNLYFLDQAISDARAALAQDPQSEYLNAHLADSMMRKVRFLQQAADIAGTEI